jgi:hypothetical protein
VSATLYLEGGGDSKELHARCREGFRKLLEKCGFVGHMPRLVACGGREATFDDFRTAHASKHAGDYVAMLIDSEEPVAEVTATWTHLAEHGDWPKPRQAADEQVLLMTTCMETWIVSDRAGLAAHYGKGLQTSALPPLVNMENRSRHDIQDRLMRATRKCSNAYAKGKRSFEVLASLDPATLEEHLPSFVRARRILGQKL